MKPYQDQTYYINRELSALAFQERVLAQAENTALPLLERLRFILITSKNLDEFFEVRVAEIKERIALGNEWSQADVALLSIALEKISQKSHQLIEKLYDIYSHELLPALKKENIVFLSQSEWNKETFEWVKKYFEEEIYPILSPVALDKAHPFPRLVNKSLNFILKLKGEDLFGRQHSKAVLHAPRTLPRIIKLSKDLTGKKNQFVMLSTIIQTFSDRLFPGMEVQGCYQFRVTCNSDVFLREDDVTDLADALKNKLYTRHFGNVARLEITKDCPEDLVKFLIRHHQLTKEDVYYCDGPVNLGRFIKVITLAKRPDLEYPVFQPNIPKSLQNQKNIFSSIRCTDILLHHPYQSFDPVLNFIRQATVDKQVVAIKQTLYRTGPNSKMVQALIEAARAGKEVTTIIELRARFDEESNLELANNLQKAGVLVIYGVFNYKTHAKMTLIVRREEGELNRYCHIGTGNYHQSTAKLYTDFGFFTYDKIITEDIQNIFLALTGTTHSIKLKKLWYSPMTLSKQLKNHIQFEIQQAKAGKPARIMAKLNGLTDPDIISALYKASNAGVKIDLIVRGICCLKPKLSGISENIRVISVVGRFLEHSRVYYFYRKGEERVYCSSADWMERNLKHRVEIAVPIQNPLLKSRVIDESLKLYLHDTTEAWELQANGEYIKIKPNKHKRLSAQQFLLQKLGLYTKK